LLLKTERYIEPYVRKDLAEKMVFIGGPRQVGKTTFVLHLIGAVKGDGNPDYLNWDIPEDRGKILRNELPSGRILVFDELHKYARWRLLMKGFYDRYYPNRNALLSGSAMLDFYRKGGDSLMGRYRYFRLHPYSLGEMNATPNESDLEQLLKYGGFPEPLSKGDETTWRRWQRERIDRVMQDDLRSLERVYEISLLEHLLEALPSRVGSPLSIKSLSEDLQVSHDSIKRWIEILERLYLCFRISPFGGEKIRAVKKEQKLYLIDWTQVNDAGARFENLVASQLLKFCHLREDTEGYRMELRFLRDNDKREVDFVVLQDSKPLFAVECKTGEKKVSTHAGYFRDRTSIPAFYQTHTGSADFGNAEKDVRVIPFVKLVTELGLP